MAIVRTPAMWAAADTEIDEFAYTDDPDVDVPAIVEHCRRHLVYAESVTEYPHADGWAGGDDDQPYWKAREKKARERYDEETRPYREASLRRIEKRAAEEREHNYRTAEEWFQREAIKKNVTVKTERTDSTFLSYEVSGGQRNVNAFIKAVAWRTVE